MNIELLYFDGCPSFETAYQHLLEALDEESVEAEVRWVKVESEEEAEQLRFLGSPTVRIQGLDVEREARQATDFGLKCRVYANNGRVLGWPSKEMIQETLKEVTG